MKFECLEEAVISTRAAIKSFTPETCDSHSDINYFTPAEEVPQVLMDECKINQPYQEAPVLTFHQIA